MDPRLDARKLAARLGPDAWQGDFELLACDQCGHQYLADDEHLRLYLDPEDLEDWVLNGTAADWPACRGCGSDDWALIPAQDVAPEWKWACPGLSLDEMF